MSARLRLRRAGSALVIAGIVLSTLRVDPAGDIAPAAAETALVAPGAVAADAVPRAPQAGDLTHLTFTATGTLTSSLVTPADDGVAAGGSASIEVETVAGAGVELRVGQDVVPFSRIGKRTVDEKTGVTRYTYYGVPLVAGPNTIALTALGADGLRGTTTMHRVYAPGRIASLRIEASGPFRADGSSAEQIRLDAQDAWGHRAASDQVVQLALVSGDARLERIAAGPAVAPDAAAATPVPLPTSSPGSDAGSARQTIGVALGADGGATLRLVPGLQSGEIVLRAAAGDVVRDARYFLAPNLRAPFVTGLVTAGAGAVPGPPGQADGDPDGANSRRGRIALYGTGALGSSLATFAYDTANTLQRTPEYGGAYADDPNERPYTITGDASTRRDDALSRDHLYARIDHGQSTATWGEFRARTGGDDAALGAFDQLVDGAKLDLGGAHRRVTLFAARNEIGYDRRVFAPTGLASGIALRPQIVVGSETIVLASLDARTGAVLTQTPLTRGVDYTLEYATGQLQFLEVPLPFDEAFNPREIVVTYEFDAPGTAARTVGGRAETTLGRSGAVHLGLGYVNDTSGAGNITLASQDLRGTLRGGSWSIVHATSQGALPLAAGAELAGNGGGALHAQLSQVLGGDRYTAVFDRTASGYADPFGGLSTPGLLNERVAWSHRDAAGRGEIGLDLAHQANAGSGITGSSQTTATLRARRALSKRVALSASLERRLASSDGTIAAATPAPGVPPAGFGYTPTAAQTSTQAALGIDWRVNGALSVSANRLQTLGGENDVEPAQTDAQATYDLGKGGRVFVRERWSDAPVQSFAAATQAFTGPTGGTRATQFGIQRTVGAATTLDSTWTIDHGANGEDVYAASGVRERIALGAVRGDALFQHGTAVGPAAAGFDLYGVSLSYADRSNRFRVTGSTQMRTGSGAGLSLSLAAIGALSPEFSLFSSIQDARASGGDQSDERAGLAWRPSRSDAGVTLLQYERRDGTSSIDNTQSGVLSLEQVVRVRERTEIVGRYAYKLDGDAYYAAHSSLAGLRFGQRVGSRFDLGIEGRRATVRGIGGADTTALAIEGGVRLGDQLRVGIGYNVNGTADPSLSASPTHRGVYATVTSVIDHLLGWGRR